MRFASEAWPLVMPPLLVGILLIVLSRAVGSANSAIWGAVALVLAVSVLLFFRDPTRTSPGNSRAVVAPADGKVIVAEALADGRQHVAIFLSIFDVHVNRVPYGGTVARIVMQPGKYFHAGSPAAAEGNARCEVETTTDQGTVSWRQVSGLVARKISCRIRAGDAVRTGDRFGLIYFGSRMDVYMPAHARIAVQAGARVYAGATVIAEFPNEEKP
ncbi:phosphatidylserine decarboxylase family protein [candidate division KSB1 bacterium]|nr:phosphatidylserine decarboxylase family protein [candidate division KSB1 bacterium]